MNIRVDYSNEIIENLAHDTEMQNQIKSAFYYYLLGLYQKYNIFYSEDDNIEADIVKHLNKDMKFIWDRIKKVTKNPEDNKFIKYLKENNKVLSVKNAPIVPDYTNKNIGSLNIINVELENN